MIWYILASFFPCVLVIFFSVITRSKWIGTFLTIIIIGASMYKGFFHNEWIIFLDVVSLLTGYIIVDQLQLHKHDEDEG